MTKERIMICGASGSGKTTLAYYISSNYGLPYINTSASRIWPRFGFSSHADSIDKSRQDPGLGHRYQMEILKQRINALKNQRKYVTDRSFVDLITYIIMSLGHGLEESQIQTIVNTCREYMSEVDGLIFTRWCNNTVLEINEHRVSNTYYQIMTDQVMNWVVRGSMNLVPHCVPILEINTWDLDERYELIKLWLEE